MKNVLQPHGGAKILYAIESPLRLKVIYDYIVRNEKNYAAAMREYELKLKEVKDPRIRIFSKLLAYLLKKSLLERTYEAELQVIQNHINAYLAVPESARHKELIDQNERIVKFSKQLSKTQSELPKLKSLNKLRSKNYSLKKSTYRTTDRLHSGEESGTISEEEICVSSLSDTLNSTENDEPETETPERQQ